MTSLRVIEPDGARFDDLEGFWDEVSQPVNPAAEWGRAAP
jgi:hypothetical protein